MHGDQVLCEGSNGNTLSTQLRIAVLSEKEAFSFEYHKIQLKLT